jgi:hypothetical protein
MPSTSNQTCATCRNFNTGGAVFNALRTAAFKTAPGAQPGFCQLNAPVKSADGLNFPVMTTVDFCGQWVAIPQAGQ